MAEIAAETSGSSESVLITKNSNKIFLCKEEIKNTDLLKNYLVLRKKLIYVTNLEGKYKLYKF